VSRGAPLVDVPDDEALRNLTQEEADGVLRGPGIGLVPEFVDTPSNEVDEGRVIGLAEDTPDRLPQGSTVQVLVASGRAGPTIPDVTGWDYDSARDALEDLGYEVDREREPSDTYGPGQVTRTDPEAGESAERDSSVTVYVAEGGDDDGNGGGEQVDVPDLNGMTLEEASEELEDANLTVGTVWGPESGHVIGTTPFGGSEVAEGSAVNLLML
jgi:beta-lactam-binding protein with PASTA domain